MFVGLRRCLGSGPVWFIWVFSFVDFCEPTFFPLFIWFTAPTPLVPPFPLFCPCVLSPTCLSLFSFPFGSRSKSKAFLTLLVAEEEPWTYANMWLPKCDCCPMEASIWFYSMYYPILSRPKGTGPLLLCFTISWRFCRNWKFYCCTSYLLLFWLPFLEPPAPCIILVWPRLWLLFTSL